MRAITDKPIDKLQDDLLKVERYSIALTNFVKSSDTPITIGLQGEWGTGKTSLMGLMREILDREAIATSWVNTWEYSMFVGSNETTPKVLQGMLEKLEENCKKQGTWDIGDKGTQAIKSVGKFLGNVANQMVKKQTGVNVKEAYDGKDVYNLQSEVAQIKEEIYSVIKQLIDSSGNPYEKVVFFVDDLDRINPADAVEVLEALKNIFDLPKCVYVLAIDYDVVVKGLESKFGKKSPQNEREFRSFFDKIIQVPFSMPTGTYDIANFLDNKLEGMGIELDPNDLSNFGKVVDLTVGSNPRSLKRYLNSFSLISNVKALEDDKSQVSDFMLFALLGIQISYPQVFRLIAREPEFASWGKPFASKLNLEWKEIEEKLSIFEENELLDEDWEKIVWATCQEDPFLKSRVFQILSLLNLLRDVAVDNLRVEVEAALEFASITSVDDDPDSKQANQSNARAALEGGVEEWCKSRNYNADRLDKLRTFISLLTERAGYLEVKYTKSQISFRNTQKSSGGSNILYLNSISGTHIKGATAAQNNQESFFKALRDNLSEKVTSEVKERVVNENTTQYSLTFSIALDEVNYEGIETILSIINSYKEEFH